MLPNFIGFHSAHQAGKMAWDLGTAVLSFIFIGLLSPIIFFSRPAFEESWPNLFEIGEAAMGCEYDLLSLMRFINLPFYALFFIVTLPIAVLSEIFGWYWSEYPLNGGNFYWDSEQATYQPRYKIRSANKYLPELEQTDPPSDGYRGFFSRLLRPCMGWCTWGGILLGIAKVAIPLSGLSLLGLIGTSLIGGLLLTFSANILWEEYPEESEEYQPFYSLRIPPLRPPELVNDLGITVSVAIPVIEHSTEPVEDLHRTVSIVIPDIEHLASEDNKTSSSASTIQRASVEV